MTSKRIQGLLVGVLALLWSLGIATAAGATSGDILYIQGETASVHQDPSKSAPVLIQLNRGHKVMEMERQGSWVKIRMFHTIRNGWVQSSLVAPHFPGESAVAPAEPKIEKSPTAPPQPKTEEARVVVFSVKRKAPPVTDVEVLIEATGRLSRYGFKFYCRLENRDGEIRLAKFGGHVPKSFLINVPKDFAAKGFKISCKFRSRTRNRLRIKMIIDDQVRFDKTFR